MDFFLKMTKLALVAGFLLLIVATVIASGVLDEPVQPFYGDFEGTDLDLNLWQVDDAGGCSFQLVEAPVRAGNQALSIQSPTKGRCEVLPWVGSTVLKRLVREPFNEERWYAFSIFLPEGWETQDRNEVIAQWHGSKDVFFGEKGGRGPPLALRIVGDEWRITYGADADLLSTDGPKARNIPARRPLVFGRWTDWKFRVKWSWEDDGITQVWMNDEKIVELNEANAYNDFRGVYLKIGSYHPATARSLFVDRVRVANNEADLRL